MNSTNSRKWTKGMNGAVLQILCHGTYILFFVIIKEKPHRTILT